ncbi:MAG: tetraacyldisaccharide 4'-kinase [Hoeflea sp.]|uniref:tetraacyldisaccharide 4'-kinase n=1 Tax=Hoeflea sp. TaxID=1940281 RepID=UPI001DD202B5|nr:tetraacyldisaccharide 4'-kinase [Hoeflea sp.]MBU4529110.1 tetraacyldisaccharide 4'-kinase [Alphaproteobacteria bacterium]MBU4543515.1 tetraacyldisaccharide 4'-kinase [Alphaproteobacteria bacterium]MBU4549140.1 tetraacyldisaccharide 4'-kinase [Alphaproteobacteria bacterium]MBV1725275.1 tetraacyldisaccharide 4'-kinase [Hoeflea sp.]MBV1785236.1 tetraacyldisaccharide 4'-kinase [Hoeflea sp.]
MVSEAPPFWWQAPGIQSSLLSPFAWVYGRVARRILDHRVRKQVPLPVICVGNFTVGGSGKTPTALALAEAAIARGLKPGFLSRGYGGGVRHATVVDPSHDTARLVGDEPMLLAARALTVVSANRIQGAELLVREGADLIIMDDGFQSARLVFDQALLVVDARRGIGNGCVFPAGPVRAPVIDQVRHGDALIVVGEGDGANPMIRMAARAAKPIHLARFQPLNAGRFKDRNCLAFAAIGDPDKFFTTLEDTGVRLVQRRGFPDHHHFTSDEIEDLLAQSELYGLDLITTSKDYVRLQSGHGRALDLLEKTAVLEIELAFDNPHVPGAIIDAAIAAFKRRQVGV